MPFVLEPGDVDLDAERGQPRRRLLLLGTASRDATKGADRRIVEARSGYLLKLNYAESVLRSRP